LGQNVEASNGAEVGIHRSAPESDDRYPSLIIFPSIFCVTAELSQHADQLAASGAVVLAFDPFARSEGSGGR
jgi:dienelactone hydrolase